jgi:hypothetical protein
VVRGLISLILTSRGSLLGFNSFFYDGFPRAGVLTARLSFLVKPKATGGNQMRKRIITQGAQGKIPPDENWLDLEDSAQAELTSEDASHPIESALNPGLGLGWRASEPGQQKVRLLFDKPLRVKRVHLVFHEDEVQRTQEFLLRWSPDGGRSYREIVRQQYNFSPPDNTREIEDYEVDLVGLTALEIIISPDISGGCARASIAELRLA